MHVLYFFNPLGAIKLFDFVYWPIKDKFIDILNQS